MLNISCTNNTILSKIFRGWPTEVKNNSQDNPALQSRLVETEEAEIKRILGKLNGNKTQAAQVLGISRSTFYRKFRKLKGGA